MTLISFFKKRKSVQSQTEEKSIACIITGYKNVDITIPCVESLLGQRYTNFMVYLVLDNCANNTKYPIVHKKLKILIPEIPLNSKLKSIKNAIDHFSEDHEFVLIFDPDNIVPIDYLVKLNEYTHRFDAIQTRRTAKNSSTILSRLDAIGEIYHNFCDRRNLFRLGSSATISGSGMLIRKTDFIDFINSDHIQSKINGVILGEDKMLQNFLVGKMIRIAYADDILLYDEKVNTKHQVRRQRIRWLNTYFENVKESISLIFKGINNYNWNQFLFGAYNLYPPLFLVFLFSLVLVVLSFFISHFVSLLLVAGIAIFLINFVLTLYFSNAPKTYFLALVYIPFFILQQIYSLLHLGKAKGNFLVTGSNEAVSLNEIHKEKRI